MPQNHDVFKDFQPFSGQRYEVGLDPVFVRNRRPILRCSYLIARRFGQSPSRNGFTHFTLILQAYFVF